VFWDIDVTGHLILKDKPPKRLLSALKAEDDRYRSGREDMEKQTSPLYTGPAGIGLMGGEVNPWLYRHP
jgi:hypothetical protein